MQDHRSACWPAGVAQPGTPEHEHQRRLILELAIVPPSGSDDVSELARVLGLPVHAIEAAADGLVTAGLAERSGGRLRATPVVLALEALWPIAM